MLKFTITRSGLAAIGRRGYQAAGRKAIGEAAFYWWEKYLPLHFQMIAYIRYLYKSRTKKYTAKKLRRAEGSDGVPAIGDPSPLVFTGRSRERALSAPHIVEVAKDYQTYRADVIIDAPAFNLTAGTDHDLRDEVTRFTSQEEVTMGNIFALRYGRELIAQGVAAPKRTRRIAA